MQGRFHIRTSRIYFWNDREFVDVFEACTILHSMLVRFSKGGELHDEQDNKGDLLNPDDIVMEFYYDSVEHIEELDGIA